MSTRRVPAADTSRISDTSGAGDPSEAGDPRQAGAPSAAGPTTEPVGMSSALAASLGAIIAERVREFRRDHGWTVGMLASESGLSKGMLSKIENAQSSPSLATLARLSEALSVPVTAFFRGLSEEQDLVYVKAGGGLDIQHKGSGPGHRYQMLGTMRAPYDSLEPMLVTLTERTEVFPLYQHAGTEILFMITGKMDYCYGDQRYLLEPGDAIQFVGEVMHGPGELITLPIQFLAIKSVTPGG